MSKNKNNILKDDIETTKKIANENLVDKSVKKNRNISYFNKPHELFKKKRNI